MNKWLSLRLKRFSGEAYYIQKKAEYTLKLLLFIYCYATLMFITDLFIYQNYLKIAIQFLAFSFIMYITYKIWLTKRIEMATNIAALLGLGFAVYLFFEPVSMRFYMQIVMAMLVTTAGYVKVYQFVITYICYVVMLILQVLYYVLDLQVTSQSYFDWNAHVLSVFGISALVICLYFLKSISEKELETASKLNDIMEKDDLTDLPNRRKFTRLIETLIGHNNLNFMMIDIDHFKKVNDEYGHSKGDDVLKEFAKLIQDMTRSTDYVFRWGGEEFVMIIVGESEGSAYNIAERLRRKVEAYDFDISMAMTISIGITFIPENITSKEIQSYVNKADKALYRAKENGRNQTRN